MVVLNRIYTRTGDGAPILYGRRMAGGAANSGWGAAVFERFIQLVYSATIAVEAHQATGYVIAPTDAVAFTISSPLYGVTGQRITIRVLNQSGAAIGAVTWGTAFKLSAWTQPANGFSRSITYEFNGTNWIEVSRTPADVPN